MTHKCEASFLRENSAMARLRDIFGGWGQLTPKYTQTRLMVHKTENRNR